MKLAVALILALAAIAHADDASAPWSAGVSAEQKAAAHQLLEAGNALFLEHKYADALERYNSAVSHWDHPAIRFNIVRCLIQLDRAAEASDNLELALKYGSTPLEDAVYAEAIAYQKLLAKQTGELVVRCDQPAVMITLDGQPFAKCPGSETRRVATGRHQLVAARDGFLTKTSDVEVSGGKRDEVSVTLIPLAETARVVHRWPAWVPWVVFGGGLAVVGAGALLEGFASSKMSDFDRALLRDCAGLGCGPDHPMPAADAHLESTARLYSGIGGAVLATGAAATIAGGVLLYMNRGRTVFGERPIDITPMTGGAAVTLHGAF